MRGRDIPGCILQILTIIRTSKHTHTQRIGCCVSTVVYLVRVSRHIFLLSLSSQRVVTMCREPVRGSFNNSYTNNIYSPQHLKKKINFLWGGGRRKNFSLCTLSLLYLLQPQSTLWMTLYPLPPVDTVPNGSS